MDQIALFALLGLGSGALIAGLALGVVLSYQGSATINLAMGAMAMIGAYVFTAVETAFHGLLRGPVAVVVTVAVVMVCGALVETVVFRPLRAASPLSRLAASFGVLLAAQAAMLLIFGTTPRAQPSILPAGVVMLWGITVPVDRFVVAAIVVAAALALSALYRWTRFGLASRAAAENESAALLAGLSPNGLSLVNAVMASLIAGLMGVLAAPLVQLDSSILPLQVVPALAAALFARFSSFWVAAVAGMLIGVSQSLVYWASVQDWFPTDNGAALPGLQQLLVFVVIVVAMYTRGAALPGRGQLGQVRLPALPRPGARPVTPALVATAAGVVAFAVLPFDFRQALTNSLIGALIVMSYVVMTGYTGQISVVQLALSGIAGFGLLHLTTDAGIGFPLGPLLAIGGATMLGVLTAASALRVRGVNLAVVSLAAALAMESFVFSNTTWGEDRRAGVGSPHLFGINLGTDARWRGIDGALPSPIFGLCVLGVTAVLGLYLANLRRTHLGLRMIAVRANESAAAAAGINVRNTKLAAFAVSAVLASVAGVLVAYNFGSVSASRYGALSALGLVAYAYVGGITRVAGAVIAGLMSTEAVIPHLFDAFLGISGTWMLLVGGVSLVLTLIFNPDGIAGAARGRKRPAVAS